MYCAGFVLAGGKSVRMGRDKALLTFGSRSLIEAVTGQVSNAVGSVTLVGDPSKYTGFGHPVCADLFPGCGPISGLHAALRLRIAPWNLIVACDMPGLHSPLLCALIQRAASVIDTDLACVVPRTEDGQLEPLCAVYHFSCLRVVEQALSERRFKMKSLLSELHCLWEDGYPSRTFANINTPEDWNEVNRR